MENLFIDIYRFGKYYYPASSHYGDYNGIITCDRCLKEDIKCCIGWKEHDLCMACMNFIDQYLDTYIILDDLGSRI